MVKLGKIFLTIPYIDGTYCIRIRTNARYIAEKQNKKKLQLRGW